MSVRTTADEHLDAAKQDIRNAVKNLSVIFVDRCYGSDEFCPDRRRELLGVYRSLMELLEVLE